MKKIIVISYFFPPCAKAGAHRAYAMGEYLPRFGWEPIFIAPEKGYYGRIERIDYALMDSMKKYPIYRLPFIYPYNNRNMDFLPRSIRKMWETMLIPDGKVLWNKTIKKRIEQIIIRHKPRVLFITATPFSSFLLAPFLKMEFGLPVVLDYRDPWAINPSITHKSRIKAKLNSRFEKKCLDSCDLATTASYHMIDFIKKGLGSYADNVNFFGFPYGYDGDFFRKEILPIPSEKDEEKVIGTFAGFVHGDLDAEIILKGIQSAVRIDKNVNTKLKIVCYGTLFGRSTRLRELLARYGLARHVYLYPFRPYLEFLKILRKSSFLILPLGESPVSRVLYPTKFFDYLGVKRPILYIGAQSQVSATIKACNAGVCANPDPDSISEALSNYVNEVDEQKLYNEESNYKKLDRITIFSDFCMQLDKL